MLHRSTRICLFVAMIAVATSVALAAGAVEADHLKLYSVSGKFDDVKQDVALAIETRGLVVERTLRVGEMLERTAKDVGATKTIYGNAEALQFCSASISRRMMEVDPANIVFCPYTIVIYTLAGDSRKVYVGYRRPTLAGSGASQAALREVEGLLDGIVREALGLK